jgi:hypothetical protein
MAFETELANIINQTDVVSGMAVEAFTTQDTVWPLILTDIFPDTTNVIKFRKGGKLEAAAGTQSTALAYSANHEIVETATTVAGTRKETAVKITLEAERFGGPYAQVERGVQEAMSAFGRLSSAELKTLFSSISGAVTATTVLAKDNILDARYTVVSSVKNKTVSPKLVGYFDYKGMNEIAKELTDTSASAFVGQIDLGVLGIATGGKPKGELFDVIMFETDGLPTDSGDDVGCVWDPNKAFCAGVDGIDGFRYIATPPNSQNPWWELYFWTFWHMAEHNDTAAVRVKSDT